MDSEEFKHNLLLNLELQLSNNRFLFMLMQVLLNSNSTQEVSLLLKIVVQMLTMLLLLLDINILHLIILDTIKSETRGDITGEIMVTFFYLFKEKTEMELVESKNILQYTQSFIDLYKYSTWNYRIYNLKKQYLIRKLF